MFKLKLKCQDSVKECFQDLGSLACIFTNLGLAYYKYIN